MLTGSVVIYVCGVDLAAPLICTSAGTRRFVDGVYPFVPGDLVKLYLAAAALPGAWNLVRRLRSKH